MVLVLRAPGFVFEVLNIDESDFYLYGQSLVEGGSAYVSFVEKKPPLVYGFFASLIGSGATDLRWIRVWTALWVLLGSVVVRKSCLAAGLGSRASWAGAFAFAAFSSNITVATDCETLMNLPIACGAFFAVRHALAESRRTRLLLAALAGASCGLAVCFKHQAGMAFLALVGFLVTANRDSRVSAILSASLGFVTVLMAVSSWFFATGRGPEFLEWNLYRNFAYREESSPLDLPRTSQALALYGLANGGVFLALGLWAIHRAILPAHNTSTARRRRWLLLASWQYWTAWLGVSLGGRFYGHYFLQLVPGVAFLAAGFLDDARFQASRLRRLVVLLVCLSVAGFGANTWARGLLKRNYPSQDVKAIEVANWLRVRTRPEERVFVWGYFNPVYYLADRRPASRFINPSPVVGDFDPLHVPADFDARPYVREDDAALLVRDLEADHCAVIVDTAPSDLHGWSRFPLAVVPALERYVREKFYLETIVAGAHVYRRIQATNGERPIPDHSSWGEKR